MDWLALIRAPRLGTAGALRLLQHCGSAAGCFTSDIPADLHAETRAAGLRAPDRSAAGGMALGIDAASHKGGKIVAVWGTGPEKPYPLRLRDGAKLVESGADQQEELGPLLDLMALPAAPPPAFGEEAAAPEDPEYKLLLNSLDFAPTSVDASVERTSLTPDVLSSMLLMLELQGHVETSPGG